MKERTYKTPRYKVPDLRGVQFGRLEVVGLLGSFKNKIYLKCQCSCGVLSEVAWSCLKSGWTKSCGCLKTDNLVRMATTHGGSAHELYSTWQNMHQRCGNPKHGSFKYYGGRGIRVCDEWGKFEVFLGDVGTRPLGMTLDRKDNDGPYSKENCRWATHTEQMQNSRQVSLIEHDGKRKCIAQVARDIGMHERKLHYRLTKCGLPLDAAVAPVLPKRPKLPTGAVVEIKRLIAAGASQSVIGKKFGVSQATISYALNSRGAYNAD